MRIDSTDKNGVTVDGKFVTWELLQRAAKQEDKGLAVVYADILKRAASIEEKRVISEDWKAYGYPLRTGFSQYYRGQHVMRAWEIRRAQRNRKDARVAYILTWDRSDNSRTREASPEFADYDQALAWVRENYHDGRGWHDESDGTADMWLYA